MTCHSVLFYSASFVKIIYLQYVHFPLRDLNNDNVYINCLIICYMSHITINVLFLFLYSLSVIYCYVVFTCLSLILHSVSYFCKFCHTRINCMTPIISLRGEGWVHKTSSHICVKFATLIS
jgi:hypothetical protein